MRFSLFLALVMASLSLAVSAQTYHKPKAKPVHREQEAKKAAPTVKEPKLQQDSAAQQLRRTEQSSAKVAASKKGQPKAGKAGLMKTQHEKPNPPIRFSSAKGGGAGLNAKGGNEYKGRLRQKGGSHHH
jgi:Tfp pilus assembly protein FimV